MRIRNTAVQIAVLILAATAIAVIANGFAGRERRLKLVAYWPNARRVPPRVPETVLPTPSPAPTATAAPTPVQPTTTTVAPSSPAPVTPPIATTTTQSVLKTPAPAPEPASAPGAGGNAPDVLTRFTAHPDKPYIEISGDDTHALHSKGVLFLDARRTSVYEEGHIPGARSYSVWESDIDDKVSSLFNERSDPRDQNLPIVIYCSGCACEDSHMLAQKLWGIQFNNVYVYKDGYPDWQKHGWPVKTGGNP